jgi:UDP-N-acetylglucosamine 2-epimerase (non-hydrolysing)
MKRIIVLVGTRPEAIKMAPVIAALRSMPEHFTTRVCSSGQHRELLTDALADFDIEPDISLDVMTDGQTLSSLSARLFSSIDAMLVTEKPDAVLVQGDTTTVMVAALAAFYRGIAVGHVEAGLRSHNLHAPFPEELNRRVATLATTWHFAPTTLSRDNLVKEGVDPKTVYVTGNPVIDALLATVKKIDGGKASTNTKLTNLLSTPRKRVLITAHRRENFGAPFIEICGAVATLAAAHPAIDFIYPVHPNPNVKATAHEKLGAISNIHLLDPLPYTDFVLALKSATLVLSDSGGLQEEAPALGKPVLVMRDVTERPEGVDAGVNLLVGSNKEKITATVEKLLTDESAYKAIAHARNPFGDGTAGQQIAEILRDHWSKTP